MRAVFRSLRPYFITLAIVWLALVVAANIYAQKYPANSHWIMTGVLPAFLFEAIFFLGAVFEGTRQLFSSIERPLSRSLIMIATAIVPFLIVTLTAGTYDSHALLILVCLCVLLSFWWILFPHRIAYDAGFLIIAAAPMVLKVFQRLYVTPVPRVEISVLGHLMWVRLALIALLVQREFQVGPVGFWPNLKEWREGVLQFLLAIVPVSLIGIWIHFTVWSPLPLPPAEWLARSLGYFFGIMWVVALSEDVFRSVITQMFLRHGSGKIVAVIASGVLFGAAHLWAADFPNWRFAIVATIAHAFFTVAYIRTGSVRASMVAHAFIVTTWRMVFRSV
jgi:membrane protease YdiL (CAAX protease family)